jgi:hypothetical protein
MQYLVSCSVSREQMNEHESPERLILPNKLRAYIFADRKSHSPERAPSGVKHDMLVAFITCRR